MSWHLTMLVMHLLCAGAALFLYRQAPCWMQKIVCAGFAAAMVVCAFAFVLALAGLEEWRWPVFLIGLLFGHLTTMVYLWRLIFQGHIAWTRSSQRSPSSPA